MRHCEIHGRAVSEPVRTPASGVIEELQMKFERRARELFRHRSETGFWIWGAATKGVLIDYHLQRLVPQVRHRFRGLVDLSPAKQGKFSSVVGSRILSPAAFVRECRPGETVLVANPNYVGEVRRLIHQVGAEVEVVTF